MSEHKSQCLLWKRILNSYIAGFIASGIDRTSKESEARQEETVMVSRTIWSQKRKHRRRSNHSHCVLYTITVFDSSIDFGSLKQTNKQTKIASSGQNYKALIVLWYPESLKFKTRQQSTVQFSVILPRAILRLLTNFYTVLAALVILCLWAKMTIYHTK